MLRLYMKHLSFVTFVARVIETDEKLNDFEQVKNVVMLSLL